VEIVDIFTHKIMAKGETGLAAFIIKGKSFKTITAKDVSHQIYRLKKINGLKFAIFAYSGNLLDQPRDEFVTTAIEIECDYAFFDSMDLARLFVSEGFICPRDGKIITQLACSCGYSPIRQELNILQKEALKELSLSHKLNQRSGLIVLPTGVGKTRIAAKDAYNFGDKMVLYVAHTQEILDVAEDEFSNIFGQENLIRITNPDEYHENITVKLSTIQLISNHIETIKGLDIDYLVIDEFHHAAATTYRTLIENSNPEYLLGLTATPFRGDRQDVVELCDGNILINAELRTAIDYGILSPYHYIGCFDDIDYSNIKHDGIRYDIRDLEKALILPERDEAIAEKWFEYLENKQTLAFCCSKNHANRCCEKFNEKGIASVVYLGDTPRNEREFIQEKFKKGEIKIIISVDVLNEGADFPFVEGLMFLRPTESKRIFYQQFGRGLRRFTGKKETVVLDFIGNFKNSYRILEYLDLSPYEDDRYIPQLGISKNLKGILNLPLDCRVTFDDRVIDIFCTQYIAGERITRHNIGRILVYSYKKLCERLGKLATKKDVDRNLLLHSGLYITLFGSWMNFMKVISQDQEFIEEINGNAP
jgi:superfamily II DNA or RNA helicase